MIQALQEAREASRDPGAPIRIILIEMPPRHAKTTTVMHAVAWRILRDPAVTNAYLTYGQNLAESKSRLMRAHVQRDQELASDMANLAEWRTPWGGGLLAGGITGPLTGKGIDGFCVIDDPHKNRQEADSEVIRETVWEQFTTVAYTLATAATGNVMLAFAAVLLGVVVGLERRASGGILAPILTHCTWSLTMLFALPLVFA